MLFAVVGTSIFESDDGGQSWPGTYANPRPQGRIPFVATNQRTGATYDLWFGDVRLHRGTCTTPSPPAPGGAQRCNASARVGRPVHAVRWRTRRHGRHRVSTRRRQRRLPGDVLVRRRRVFNTLDASPACHTPAWNQPNVTPHALWNFTFSGSPRAVRRPRIFISATRTTAASAPPMRGAAAVAGSTNGVATASTSAGEPTRALTTICCFGGGRATRLFISGAGLTGASAEITQLSGRQPAGFRAPRTRC